MAHPLLDRHDTAAQRNHVPNTDVPIFPPMVDMTHTNELLAQLVTAQTSIIGQLCITDREPAQAHLNNFPYAGLHRLIVRRTGTGGLVPLASGVPTLVCQPNETRLGAFITLGPAAASPVLLVLTVDLIDTGSGVPLTAGAPQITLGSVGGGSADWDFRLSNLLWCGSVTAIAQGGASSVSWAEV